MTDNETTEVKIEASPSDDEKELVTISRPELENQLSKNSDDYPKRYQNVTGTEPVRINVINNTNLEPEPGPGTSFSFQTHKFSNEGISGQRDIFGLPPPPVNCDVYLCTKRFSGTLEVWCHKENDHELTSEERLYICEQCDLQFIRAYELSRHNNSEHTNMAPWTIPWSIVSAKNYNPSRKNSKKQSDREDFHINNTEAKAAKIPRLENLSTDNEKSKSSELKPCCILNMVQTNEPDEKTCNNCCQTYPSVDTFNRHRKTFESAIKSPFKCGLCKTKFLSSCELLSHQRLKETSDQLCKPKAKQELREKFKCDFCDVAYYKKEKIEQHTKSKHIGYKCEYCEKVLTTQKGLSHHRTVHTGEKSYKCDFCGNAFARKGTLIDHIRTHTGEKPYKCDICDASFAQHGPLYAHRRIHTGEKPYKCEHCDFSARSSHPLKKHLQSSHSENQHNIPSK